MPTLKRPSGRRRGDRPSIVTQILAYRSTPGGRHVAPRRPLTGSEAVDQRADLVSDFPGPDSPVPVDARYVHAVTAFGLGGGR